MKQNKEQMGPDYFRLYLIGHLRDHWLPQYTDKRFIEERTEAATALSFKIKIKTYFPLPGLLRIG